MDWKPYAACCYRNASDADAGFCPDCGHPFLRCMAFAECQSLVAPTHACPVCVAPSLMIDAGAVVQSKLGERVSVPLILRNISPASRALWVKRIVKWDGRVEEPMALTWEQIEPGTERHFTLDTPPMAEGGTYSFHVILVIATRYKGLEEEYAFAARVTMTVGGKDPQSVSHHYEFSNLQLGTGAFIGAGAPNLGLGMPAAGKEPGASTDRKPLVLERAERYELEQGIRGYRKENLRVPRHVAFGFQGFKAGDSPSNGTTMVLGGRLVCGRNSRTPDPDGKVLPSDLCLRAYDARSAALDEPATMAISRHHFDLVVVNDRLCVQARATHGMDVNGTPLTSGAVAVLMPGDRLSPIPGRPDKLTLQVSFSSSIGSVERIDIARTPAMKP